jgi:sulfofructose kinase
MQRDRTTFYTRRMAASAPSRSWDVIGVGENSVDLVLRLPGFPAPGGALAKMVISEQATSCGGQMATALAACARLGLRTKYVATVGNDHNGRLVKQELARHHIDIADVIVRNAPSRSAVILVDERSGDRVVLWHRDRRLELRSDELPLHAIASARVVHVDDVDEEAGLEAARAARRASAMVTTDLDRATAGTAALVREATHPILAAHLPSELTGVSDVEEALRALRRPHHAMLCVTLGVGGSLALEGDRIVRVPAFRIHAVDTTGAGDVFRGAFIYALLQAWRVEETLRFANAAAAVSCTRPGALNSAPALDEVHALMAAV